MITTTADPFVALADLKTFLKKGSATVDDSTLTAMIAAACQMIVDRIGQVSSVTATETVTSPGAVIVLHDRPVIEVTAVTGDDLDVLEITSKDGGLLAYSGTASSLDLTCTCGRDPVPGTIAEAGLELAAHLWRGSQNATSGTVTVGEGDTSIVAGSMFALPIRVRELLGLGQNLPHDEVLVA